MRTLKYIYQYVPFSDYGGYQQTNQLSRPESLRIPSLRPSTKRNTINEITLVNISGSYDVYWVHIPTLFRCVHIVNKRVQNREQQVSVYK